MSRLRAVVILAVVWLACSCRREADVSPVTGGVPEITFAANPAATTPQLPWLAAAADGTLAEAVTVRYQAWHTATEFQTQLLAGQGDVWLGHLDGFARARRAGAPVRLVMVTGWRKWAIVTRHEALTVAELGQGRSPLRLPCAPPGNPGQLLLEKMLAERPGRVTYDGLEANPLMLRLLSGREEWAFLPEPMVSVLLRKDPSLRVVTMLEDLYAARTGGPNRLPWAGIACHERLLRAHPQLAGRLVACLAKAAERLNRMSPAEVAAQWPDHLAADIPREMLAASLERDLILVRPAASVEAEITSLLSVIAPELPYDPELLWR